MPMSMDFILPQPVSPGPRNVGKTPQGVPHQPASVADSKASSESRQPKDKGADFRARLNEAHETSAKRSESKAESKTESKTEPKAGHAGADDQIMADPVIAEASSGEGVTNVAPLPPVVTLPEKAIAATPPSGKIDADANLLEKEPAQAGTAVQLPVAQFSAHDPERPVQPELESPQTGLLENTGLPSVAATHEQVAVHKQAAPPTVSVAVPVEFSRGETLPPGGKPLPPSEAASQSMPIDIPVNGQEQLGSAGGELPALSRARFDASANATAIREHLESVTRGTSQMATGELPTMNGSGDAEPVTTTTSGTLSPSLSTVTHPATSPLPDRATPSPAPTVRSPEFTLAVPAGEPGWEADVSNRLLWLVERNTPSAVLRLDPPELGAVEVRISTEGDKASVTFVAHNGQARDALESALPKLREMLGENGIELADARVSRDSTGNHQDANSFAAMTERSAGASGADVDDVLPVSVPLTMQENGRGLVDYYI